MSISAASHGRMSGEIEHRSRVLHVCFRPASPRVLADRNERRWLWLIAQGFTPLRHVTVEKWS